MDLNGFIWIHIILYRFMWIYMDLSVYLDRKKAITCLTESNDVLLNYLYKTTAWGREALPYT